MNRRTLALVLALAALAAVPAPVAQEAPLLGFTQDGSRAQMELEAATDR